MSGDASRCFTCSLNYVNGQVGFESTKIRLRPHSVGWVRKVGDSDGGSMDLDIRNSVEQSGSSPTFYNGRIYFALQCV